MDALVVMFLTVVVFVAVASKGVIQIMLVGVWGLFTLFLVGETVWLLGRLLFS